jgi:hypothetical protein
VVKLPANGRAKNRINGGLVFDPATGKDIEVGGYAEGERPLGLWAWQSNGIFATDEAAKGAPNDLHVTAGNLNKPKHGGDVNWADLNGDKIIDNKDLVFMGYRVPDKIGGMQNTFSFKGLTLRFTMDYALGHVISNGALARAMGQGRAFNEGAPAEALGSDVWMNSGDVGKKYPALQHGRCRRWLQKPPALRHRLYRRRPGRFLRGGQLDLLFQRRFSGVSRSVSVLPVAADP